MNKENIKKMEDNNTTSSVIKSFNETFESGNLWDILSQVGEVGLDYVFELSDSAPIFKKIPVLGLIVSGTKTIANIQSHLLAKKVFNFFYGIKDIPVDKRRKFAEEYCQVNREDTAVALLSILDRMNNQNNVPIICRLMKAKMDEKISIQEFNRCILALERVSYSDLDSLIKFDENYYEEGVAESFEAAGLVCLSLIDPHLFGVQKMTLSKTGRILLLYGLERPVSLNTPRRIGIISDFG